MSEHTVESYEDLVKKCVDLERQLAEAKRWVNDLQSGMYINCVYCGHRYGPRESTPVSMADVLKEHIEQCPKHPMSQLRSKNAAMAEALKKISASHNMSDDSKSASAYDLRAIARDAINNI